MTIDKKSGWIINFNDEWNMALLGIRLKNEIRNFNIRKRFVDISIGIVKKINRTE